MIAIADIAHAQSARAIGTRRGGRIDFAEPDPKNVRLLDLCERMARTPADASAVAFYSLAQRATLIANNIGPQWGALAGVYALVHQAPLALTGALEYAALGTTNHFAASGIESLWKRLHEAICDALDLDHPVPKQWQHAIAHADMRLRTAEIRIGLAPGTTEESACFVARGLTPLFGRIAPLGPDSAHDTLVTCFERYGKEAGLPRTKAWEGIQ